jgi:hypothetical protein
MDFDTYIERHYTTACNLQRAIWRDSRVVEMLREGRNDRVLLLAWMKEYGLFQGITGQHRVLVVDTFLQYASKVPRNCRITVDTIEVRYSELLLALYRQVARSWMSATSKLLWCLYPHDIVIFDAFVHRSLVVMQCLDEPLGAFPRIGVAPKIVGEGDLATAVSHYMNYQTMVRHLLSVHANRLEQLRSKHSESYPFDIRIIDKLLSELSQVFLNG